MNKILFALFIIVSYFTTANASITIQSAVIFGAASKSCKGSGICKASTKTSAGMMAATFTYDGTVPSKINVIIDESQLTQVSPDIVANIRAGRFVQEENWELPADITAALSLTGTHIIPKGSYTVTVTGGKVHITLSIARPVAAR